MKFLDAKDPATMNSLGFLGDVLTSRGKLAEAETCTRQVLEQKRRTLGNDDPSTFSSIGLLGWLLMSQDKLSEAEPFICEAVDRYSQKPDEYETHLLFALYRKAALREAQGNYNEALQLLTEIEVHPSGVFNSDNTWQYGALQMTLGKVQMGMGDFAMAEKSLLIAARNLFESESGRVANRFRLHMDKVHCAQAIVDLYSAWQQTEPEQDYAKKVDEWKRKIHGLSQSEGEDDAIDNQ